MDSTDGEENICRTRTAGIGARGVPDQYADGKAAQVWQKYIGDHNERTGFYKEHIIQVLRDHKCKTVFDVACGTGIDSVLLVEEGFDVASCDASDKMLKFALKTRWERRKEEAFDKWEIAEGNWLHLDDAEITTPKGGFDALICMGNSFAHLPDFDGKQTSHYTAIKNFYRFLRPGGILVIDHRNYDHIVSGNKAPMKNIYYASKGNMQCKTSVLMVNGKHNLVTIDYYMYPDNMPATEENLLSTWRLSYYPHLVENFNKIITDVFGKEAKHTLLGDFRPVGKDNTNPSYYIHICQKPHGASNGVA